jgi:V/A-type H+-transporting ATPase subunit F
MEARRPIAVIGERELVMGMRLIGLNDTFVGTGTEGAKELQRLAESAKYSMILASQELMTYIPATTRATLERTIDPLVVFLPTPGEEEEIESLDALAKRVLGISIANVKAP